MMYYYGKFESFGYTILTLSNFLPDKEEGVYATVSFSILVNIEEIDKINGWELVPVFQDYN